MKSSFLAPITRLFSRLKYSQKFALISLFFILPLAGFYPLVEQHQARIRDYGTLEFYGTLYLRPLQNLLQDVQAHQRLVQARLAGGASSAAVAEVQAKIDQDFRDLQAIDQQYGGALKAGAILRQGATPEGLETEWDGLKAAALNLSESDSQIRHSTLIADIRALISHIGDTSFLILDPDLDTYYLMDTVLLKLPEIQSLLSQTILLSEQIARRGSYTPDERTQLIILTGGLRYNLDNQDNPYNLDVNVRKSFDYNPSGRIKSTVEASLQQTLEATRQFVETVESKIINTETPDIPPANLLASGQNAVQANADFYAAATRALEDGIQVRRTNMTNQLVLALVVAVAGILVGLLIGLLVMRSISRPLNRLTEAAQRLTSGDLSARVPIDSEDEVGQMGLAFNTFIDTLATIVRGLVDGSGKLSSGAIEIASSTNQMSAGAESQTQQVIRTSSAMEEMSATIKEVARNAQSTAHATEAAVARAREGSARVQAALAGLGQTNVSLQQLSQRSAEIDQVVKLIADIAAQTNILALNAAIEAAGAGAAGARFDVVAEEIRKLAGRTAESTAQISVTVAEVQREMQAAAGRMADTASQAEEVEQSLTDIVEGIRSVNDMVASISSSTSQQARAADQVAEALQLITQVSRQTAQATRETAATIEDLSGLARGMSDTAARFKI